MANSENQAASPVNSRICISLGYRTARALAAEADQQARLGEKLFEFCLEYLDEPKQGLEVLREFLSHHPSCKVIITFRMQRMQFQEQLKILEQAIAAGAFAFDLEIESAELARDWFAAERPGVLRILSYHDYETANRMSEAVDRLSRIPADLYKIVSTAQKP